MSTEHRLAAERRVNDLIAVIRALPRHDHLTQMMEEAAHALASDAIASGDLRPDVDPLDLMRAIYGLSTAGSAEDWPAKARKFVDILLQGSRPR